MSRQTVHVATRLDDGSWEIQGRRITFPVRITDAAAACAAYPVRVAHATRLVAGTGLTLVAVAGRTPLFVLLVDYKVSDLGDYDEVGVALLVRHRGRTGLYVHQLPVTQPFTLEAGRALWGLPKWPARAEMSINGPDATCHLADGAGRHVLTAALRALPVRLPPTVRATVTALAPQDDAVLASRMHARADGIRVAPGGTRLVLGSGHPMADELRALGLPRRPLVTVVIEHVAFDMDPAERIPH
jgi:hypothetical protein